MLTLQLIRHAKTEQLSTSGRDFDRKLTDKGIAQANLLGQYIQSYHLERGKILCSTAMCQMTSEPCKIDHREELYHASMEQLLATLKKESAQTVTLLGHNEGISDLASYCSDEDIHMQTSEIITLSFPFESWDHVSRGTGIIALRYRPDAYLPEC
jgi:phosphohistidine phosphatase